MSKNDSDRSHRVPAGEFAVIDIGSHTVRMDIFEIARDGGFTILESLSRQVNLGYDVFRSGSISPENLELLLHVMRNFSAKLAEYRVRNYRVIATSALREAFNRELAADRIANGAKLTLEILDSQQEIKLMYQAMRAALRRRNAFYSENGLGLIIGAGSVFVLCFENGLMRFCEEMPLGTVRIYDTLGRSALSFTRLIETLESADIPERIRESTGLAVGASVTLIAIGAAPRLLAGLARGGKCPDELEFVETGGREAAAACRKALTSGTSFLASALAIAPEEAGNIEAGAAIIDYFMQKFDCRRVIVPGVTTRSAVIEGYICSRTGTDDGFAADLLAVCNAVGRKYGFDAEHALEVTRISGAIFTKLRREFDFESDAGFLLAAAATLHDIGRFVDTRQHHKHSGYLIANTQLPGVNDAEQRVIAAIARYHRHAEPKESHPEFTALPGRDRVTVLKLAAILRVADALDCSRCGKFRQMKLLRRQNTLVLKVPGPDLDGERFYLTQKGGLFTQVFGLELKIEEEL